jgi:hypothetical protein
VWVSLVALRDPQGEPQFEIRWMPGPPPRMLPADVATFDQGKRWALAAITAHLETLR